MIEYDIFSVSHRLQQYERLYVAETKRDYTLISLKFHLIES